MRQACHLPLCLRLSAWCVYLVGLPLRLQACLTSRVLVLDSICAAYCRQLLRVISSSSLSTPLD